jgi:hypothetical protein
MVRLVRESPQQPGRPQTTHLQAVPVVQPWLTEGAHEPRIVVAERQQRFDQRRHHHLDGACVVAVVHLDCDTQPTQGGLTKAVFDRMLGIHPTGAEEFVTMGEALRVVER